MITRKDLIKAQQGEIDAVVLYKKMAERVGKNSPEIKQTLLQIGSDEGRHANMIRKITGKVCAPKSALANIVVLLSYIVGKKAILRIMSSSETKALDTYKPFAEQYPELETMRQDEGRHGRILMELSQKV